MRHSISDPDVDEKLLSEEEATWPREQKAKQSLLRKCAKYVLWFAVVGFSCLVGVVLGRQHNLDKVCTRQLTEYSLVIPEVGIEYHEQHFNGSFLKENIYRQEASPAVDAAWGSLGVNYRSLRVPTAEAQKSGLAPDQVKINEKYGGGYPANVEGLHHLHCLNLLRQSLYYNYDYYHEQAQGAFVNEDYIVRRHVSHCLDILRQQLMCTVDIGVLGQVWVHPDAPEPFVDFNTKHKCRNFHAIRQWAERNQLPETVPRDFLQPPKIEDRVYEEIP
ncbi:hypothetical protein BDV28DRAFT_127613 [Aspergillus coremiiformis]|uniref:Tat pathway signal sequence n=1 Tax=Aspergillus coremiiformis TaxID=138285 RepID=A0A5N6ZH22_9EURO|nr:hypothetical protein BDV28DRAFT_127613 [Aspergillus coremiiformis]